MGWCWGQRTHWRKAYKMVLLGDWMAGEVGREVTEWTMGNRRKTKSHGRQMGPLSMCQGLHGLEPKSYLETGLTVRPLFQKDQSPRCWPKTLKLTFCAKGLGLQSLAHCLFHHQINIPSASSLLFPPITLQEAKKKHSLELPLFAKLWEGGSLKSKYSAS